MLEIAVQKNFPALNIDFQPRATYLVIIFCGFFSLTFSVLSFFPTDGDFEFLETPSWTLKYILFFFSSFTSFLYNM